MSRTRFTLAAWVLMCGLAAVSAQEKTPGAPKTKAAPKAVAEVDLESRLDVKMKADFVDTPLADVLSYISDLIDIDILIDRSAEELGLLRDEPVSLNITKREVKARTILDLVLRKFSPDLDYAVRDGVLMICSSEQSFVTQVYNVAALVVPRGGAAALGDASAMTPEETALLQLIQTTVQPNTWAEAGGSGSAKILNGQLVVKHSSKSQLEVKDLIQKLTQSQKDSLKDG